MTRRIVLSSVVLVAALATTLAAPAVVHAQQRAPQPDHAFGVGLMLGVPTGLTGKYYLKNHMAIDFALGDEYQGRYDDGLEIHADVLWHPAVLTRQPNFTMPFYLGVGARYFQNDYYYINNNNVVLYDANVERFGVRVPFGILMDLKDPTIDIFFEVAVVIDLIIVHDDLYDERYYDRGRVDLNGALGARYYF